MKLRKAKKTVKGMTLIECIIALLVVGIAGTIMVVAGTTTKRFILNSNHLNNKTEAESSVGANQNVDKLNDLSAASGVAVQQDAVTITVGGYGSVNATRYHTNAASAASPKKVDTGLADDASLEFYTDFSS